MRTLLRGLSAVLVGAFVGGGLIAGIEFLGHLIFPPPPGIDLHDPGAMQQIVAQMPVAAIAMVLLAWAVGSAVGALVAARLAVCCHWIHGVCVGLLFLAGAVGTMIAIPHPIWFVVASLMILPLATAAGIWGSRCCCASRVSATGNAA